MSDEKLYEQILKQLPGICFVKDKNSVYLASNETFAKNSGFDLKDVAGKTDHDMVWKKFADAYIADDQRVIQSGKPKPHILEMAMRDDGSEFQVITHKMPFRDEAGQVVGVIGVSIDISKLAV